MTLHDAAGLYDAIKRAKRRGRWGGFPTSEETERAQEARDAWSFAHAILVYGGEQLHVKVPRILGSLFILRGQAWASGAYDSEHIVSMGAKETIAEEYRQLERLAGKADVITPRRDLLEWSGQSGALLTDQLVGVRNVTDLAYTHTADQLLPPIGALLRSIHDANEHWVDARLGNVLQDSTGRYIACDFGRSLRTTSQHRRAAYDLFRMAASASERTEERPELIWSALLEGYGDVQEIRGALGSQARHWIYMPKLPGQERFMRLVYGVDRNKMATLAETIRNRLR